MNRTKSENMEQNSLESKDIDIENVSGSTSNTKHREKVFDCQGDNKRQRVENSDGLDRRSNVHCEIGSENLDVIEIEPNTSINDKGSATDIDPSLKQLHASSSEINVSTDAIGSYTTPVKRFSDVDSAKTSQDDTDSTLTYIRNKSISPRVSLENSDERSCLVCFEAGNDENPLLERHNCPVCVSTAWKICMQCDSHLLSRQCPVCRSDYAPQAYYAVEGPSLASVYVCTDPMVKVKLISKLTLVKTIMSRANVGVWQPGKSTMVFSFPKDELGDDGKSPLCCTCAVSLNPNLIENGKFLFTNKIWDDIILQSEDGTEVESFTVTKAFKVIVDATNEKDSILLTPFPPETFDNILNDI